MTQQDIGVGVDCNNAAVHVAADTDTEIHTSVYRYQRSTILARVVAAAVGVGGVVVGGGVGGVTDSFVGFGNVLLLCCLLPLVWEVLLVVVLMLVLVVLVLCCCCVCCCCW